MTTKHIMETRGHHAGIDSVPNREVPWGTEAGYSWASCACGWIGETVPTFAEAEADRDDHLRTAALEADATDEAIRLAPKMGRRA